MLLWPLWSLYRYLIWPLVAVRRHSSTYRRHQDTFTCCFFATLQEYVRSFMFVATCVLVHLKKDIKESTSFWRHYLRAHRSGLCISGQYNEIISAPSPESALTRRRSWCPANGLSRWCFWRRSQGRCSSFWSTHPGLSPGQSHTLPSPTPSPLSRGLHTHAWKRFQSVNKEGKNSINVQEKVWHKRGVCVCWRRWKGGIRSQQLKRGLRWLAA